MSLVQVRTISPASRLDPSLVSIRDVASLEAGRSSSSMSVGDQFADISLVSTVDAKKTKLSKIAGLGKAVVVIMYSAGGNGCAAAIQTAEEFATSHRHVAFVLVNVEDSVADANKFIRPLAVTGCKSYCAKLPKGYNIREGAVPYHVVIDEEGEILLATEDATNDYIELVA
mmetsp:Transcript_12636/g.23440  ORF Transcript_12636/g.23440 Transcript_12636/m.23440 type:complete len:171 (-) Transcript_12636:92-604(-)